ncbi:MAG: hypothetical protein JWM16_2004 [Verrucomicrobiales bacterium]|nr:hypothetical protein [Verrucomicrobiales bacterium]
MKTNHTTNCSVVSLQSCQNLLRKLEVVRSDFAREFSAKLVGYESMLQLALNEAESLAFQTPFPHLVFPALAEEKANAVAEWAARQERVSSRPLAAA